MTGAGGRATADGLLRVWGMGRALCTGLGLGSPDFIFEATRRAGIFSPGRLMTAHSPPSHTEMGILLLVGKTMNQLLL